MHKLLYITNQISGPGGLERVLSIKASFLADNLNYEVNVLTLNQNNKVLFYDFSEKIIHHNISVKGNPLQYFLKYRKGIKTAIKKINPDIVIVCDDGIKGLLLPLLIGKSCSMIYERHVSKNIEIRSEKQDFIQNTITAFKFKLMDFGGSFYDKFIVLTNGNLSEWKLNNIEVIPNPLSFYPNEQSTLKNKNVLAVGKQSFQKGYDRLLESWKKVQKSHPDWHLNIFGTINQSQGLDKLANDLQVSNTIHFHEPVKNISEKYKEASIYVMSSRYEGFGMVLTEAMAYGVPCVSFDCPFGPSDIISNNTNGILVENDNIDGLSEAIITLISDSEKRNRMGSNARKSVEYYFPERIASIWDNLFKNLIEKKS